MLRQASAVLLGVVVVGCGVDARVPPADEPPATEAASQELRRRADDDGVIIANGLATSDLLANPLTTNARRVEKLRTTSLTAAFADPFVAEGAQSDSAQRVLRYLVQCALDTTEALTVNGVTYRGNYGVCSAWRTGAPSTPCLELVTACMLARNNPSERNERLSLRGEPEASDSARYQAQRTVGPQPWSGGAEVLSLRTDCPAGLPNGKDRDCGWRALPLRSCPADAGVVLGFGGRDPLDCTSPTTYGNQSADLDMMIRVCGGDEPCDASRALAASDFTCGSIRPAVRIACPASGRVTVMTAPYSMAGGNGTPTFGGTASVREMSEVEAFPLREGAFFGNMFDETKLGAEVEWFPLTQTVKVNWKVGAQGTVYGGTYSCADDKWATLTQYQSTRVCASARGEVQPRCLSQRLGKCSATCAINDGPALVGDFDYESCKDSSGVAWKNPLTSFLVNACDLLPPLSQACGRLP